MKASRFPEGGWAGNPQSRNGESSQGNTLGGAQVWTIHGGELASLARRGKISGVERAWTFRAGSGPA